MKVHKSIKDMPWPEDFFGPDTQLFRVTLNWPVIDRKRMMVATFCWNRANGAKGRENTDFRLVAGRSPLAAVTYWKGENLGKRISLDERLRAAWSSMRYCYPEISPKDEKALANWLGVKTSQNHYMPELETWVLSAMKAELLRERDARGEIRDEDVALCPETLPEGLVDFIRREVLPHDNTLLYKKGNKRGLCYACGQQVKAGYIQKFRQSELQRCPSCGKIVSCYLETSDRFKVDYVQNLATLQKGSDGVTVFIRQWHILRDAEADYTDMQAHLQEVARYAIRGNKTAKWQKEVKNNWYYYTWREEAKDWIRRSDPRNVYDGFYKFFLPPNWKETFAGTSLQYCDADGYYNGEVGDYRNIIRFFMDWAKYPAVEKLWKAGYIQLVAEKVGRPSKLVQKSIRWISSEFRELFHFPKRLLKLLLPEEWTFSAIERVTVLQDWVIRGLVREVDIKLLLEEKEICLSDIEPAVYYASVYKIVKYLKNVCDAKNAAKAETRPAFHMREICCTYNDYLRDCRDLELDLNEEQILFPRDLDDAHQRTISQVRYKKDMINKKQFAQQMAKLQKLAWEHNGLLIRPPVDGDEIIEEGKALHHCVGGYVTRAQTGATNILFIRRVNDPDTPYFTMEWLDGKVKQCYGEGNKTRWLDEPEVKAFVEAWMKEIKKRKKKNTADHAA